MTNHYLPLATLGSFVTFRCAGRNLAATVGRLWSHHKATSERIIHNEVNRSKDSGTVTFSLDETTSECILCCQWLEVKNIESKQNWASPRNKRQTPRISRHSFLTLQSTCWIKVDIKVNLEFYPIMKLSLVSLELSTRLFFTLKSLRDRLWWTAVSRSAQRLCMREICLKAHDTQPSIQCTPSFLTFLACFISSWQCLQFRQCWSLRWEF